MFLPLSLANYFTISHLFIVISIDKHWVQCTCFLWYRIKCSIEASHEEDLHLHITWLGRGESYSVNIIFYWGADYSEINSIRRQETARQVSHVDSVASLSTLRPGRRRHISVYLWPERGAETSAWSSLSSSSPSCSTAPSLSTTWWGETPSDTSRPPSSYTPTRPQTGTPSTYTVHSAPRYQGRRGSWQDVIQSLKILLLQDS